MSAIFLSDRHSAFLFWTCSSFLQQSFLSVFPAPPPDFRHPPLTHYLPEQMSPLSQMPSCSTLPYVLHLLSIRFYLLKSPLYHPHPEYPPPAYPRQNSLHPPHHLKQPSSFSSKDRSATSPRKHRSALRIPLQTWQSATARNAKILRNIPVLPSRPLCYDCRRVHSGKAKTRGTKG